MKRKSSRYWLAIGIAWITPAVGAQVVLDFEDIRDGVVHDRAGGPRAQFRGEVVASDQAHVGDTALCLGNEGGQGCLDFGPELGMDSEATVEFWCRPREVSGIVVGKQGVINLELRKQQRSVRVGLILKSGWVSCESAPGSVVADEWQHVHASWGPAGLVLILNGKAVARASLPARLDWRDHEFHFFVGTYNFPTPYDVWFYHGLIDEFSYRNVQSLPKDIVLPDAAPARVPVLDRKLPETPQPAYGVSVAEAQGRVVLDTDADDVPDADEPGVGGVTVSDGYSAVKTGKDGRYRIVPSGSAVFLFITKPSGYGTAGPWYKPLGPRVDFALAPAVDDESDFTFVHVSDTHISASEVSLMGLSRFVREVNALRPAPRFVVNSGDLVNLDKQLNAAPETGHTYFRNYVGIMNHLRMPYHNVAGDHTDSSHRMDLFPRGDQRCGKAMYWEYLGPHFFSAEYGSIHLVSVDFGYHLGERKGYSTNRVMPEHRGWLDQDMGNRTPGTFVVTTAESDLNRFCPGFADLADRHDIRLQLTGDDHVVAYHDAPVPYRVGGSLSGCWWNPACKGLCPDLSPQGYTVYRARGESLECFYKGLGQRVAVVSPRFGARLHGRVKIRAHVVQPEPGDGLAWSIGGSNWQAMEEVDKPFFRALFEAEVDTSGFRDGVTVLRVRNGADGEVRTCKVVVDNGKNAALVAGDARLTFRVGGANTNGRAPSGPTDVLINGSIIGRVTPGERRAYELGVDRALLRAVNVLTFRFAETGDGMGIDEPALHVAGDAVHDPRTAAVRQVRTAHWGEKSVPWGAYSVGNGPPEAPFCRRQDEYVFVLPSESAGAQQR